MKIQRTVPPAAAPFRLVDIGGALEAAISGQQAVKRLEKELKAYFDVPHIFLVSSGKAALTLILLGLKSILPRNEVIIPAYTCYSVPSAIVKAGLRVAVCDVEPNGFGFEIKALEKKVGEQTLCVISNHLFGIPSRLDRLRELCRKNGSILVEDAAQAMGGRDSGHLLGTIGDIGFFSLGRGKNLACGSGGIIITRSEEIGAAIEQEYVKLPFPSQKETVTQFLELMLTAIFSNPSLFWFPQGLRFLKLGETKFYRDFPMKKLSAMKAGFLRNWWKRLHHANEIRAETVEFFAKRLGLRLPVAGPLPLLRLPVLLDSREMRARLLSLSYEKGLGLSAMYPTPVHQIEEIRSLFNGACFPSAEAICQRLITIPTHSLLSRGDKEAICVLLQKFALNGGTTTFPSGIWNGRSCDARNEAGWKGGKQ